MSSRSLSKSSASFERFNSSGRKSGSRGGPKNSASPLKKSSSLVNARVRKNLQGINRTRDRKVSAPGKGASVGMDWLYMMIVGRAQTEKYEYSQEAREWLEKRITMANEMKSKNNSHSRTLSVWWENKHSVQKLGNLADGQTTRQPAFSSTSYASNQVATIQAVSENSAWKNEKGYKSVESIL